MPTGYTAKIENGITLEEFILGCSRAFGALISMRDDPKDAPFPEKIEPSDHHPKRIKEYEKKLKELNSITLEQAKKRCEKNYKTEAFNNAKYIKEKKVLKVKYDSMLTKVKAWNPPTTDHQGLKDFMVQQITDSISWDCNTDYYEKNKPKLMDPKKWLESQKQGCIKDIAYHKKQYAEEVKTCKERTKWIQDLLKSLKTK